jgi:hypothetical protein
MLDLDKWVEQCRDTTLGLWCTMRDTACVGFPAVGGAVSAQCTVNGWIGIVGQCEVGGTTDPGP